MANRDEVSPSEDERLGPSPGHPETGASSHGVPPLPAPGLLALPPLSRALWVLPPLPRGSHPEGKPQVLRGVLGTGDADLEAALP